MESFIQQALVFIGSAIVLVPIFRWLRFGAVLGYLIAGIVVGPHALKLIHHTENVAHFAELGVVLLLFLIGLEIQPRKLWSLRRHLLGLGGLQVALTTGVFTLIGLNVGFTPLAASVIGFGLSLSSTAFALQTLNERNQFNTEFGRSSFSVLLMQDLVAIPALAIIPVLAESKSEQGFSFFGTLTVVMTLVFLLLASRFLIRPAFRVIAATRAREIFTAATLFIVLGVAALMQMVGLSAALGAFIAGVLLADSEYRHEIEANLEPFKGLLMGLFFIAVGMGVSLSLIAERPIFIFSLALGYILLKAVLIYISGRFFGLSHENSKLMGFTVAQGGEFAFVIFGIALKFQMTSTEVVDLLTVVITMSMAMSPLLGLLSDWVIRYRRSRETPAYDEIADETPQVIIAGFGRFGQVFARILRTQNIAFVAIDHDSEQVELVRRFGNKVYYGDASREELLEAAGAAKAKYFILAIDNVEVSIQTARMVKEHFPNLKIFARARNRGHAFDLMALGIQSIKRETFDSSVNFVKDLLVEMGFEQEKAKSLVSKFRTHDEIMMLEQFKVRDDDKSLVSLSKQATAQLAQVLNEDSTRTFIAPPESSASAQ